MEPLLDLTKEYGLVLDGGGQEGPIRSVHGQRLRKQA